MSSPKQSSDVKTVFIVDDDRGVRESLRPLIESVGLRVETFASATEFLGNYQLECSGCLLLDVRMPGMSGLELQETLIARGISLPVLVITGYADVPTAVRAMKTGAFDFVEKPFNKRDLLEKIQNAIAQDEQAREAGTERAAILARMEMLTPREAEVMGRVVAGQANKVIAIELDISKKTVEAHRARVMEKMAVRTVAELVQASMIARGYRPESA